MIKNHKSAINKKEFFHNVGRNDSNCGNMVACDYQKNKTFSTMLELRGREILWLIRLN
jgi:hypothetical protein